LKRFEDAERDGDRIIGILRGSAVNNNGAGTGFGTPNGASQENVYRAALMRAGVKAADVSYIETHGTGTSVGIYCHV
jgi:acyl transferase domain-containing protein